MKLSIVMPVKDEGVNLPVILKILAAVVDVPHEILVVHDTPQDNTVPVVRAMQARYPAIRLVHNTLGRGVANAIQAGVAQAAGEYVLIFAVDDTGPALAIDEMLALMDGGCDLVSCTRYARGGRRLGGSLVGHALSRLANWLFRRVAGCVLTDATTGIKMIRRSAFDRLPMDATSAGWVVAFELAIRAQLAGLRLGEVPIISIDRLFGGTSTFALGPWFLGYLKWFAWAVPRLRATPHPQRDPVTLAVGQAADDIAAVDHVPA